MSCKVTVNVDDLMKKCPDSFNAAITKAAPKEINIDLAKLVKDPKAFTDVLMHSIDSLAQSSYSMNKVLNLYKKSVRSPELDKLISGKIISQFENIQAKRGYRNRYKQGKEVPKVLDKCIELFDNEDKSRVLKAIFEKQENFYPYARKMLALTASSIASEESELVGVLNSFYKVMEKEAFFNIVEQINGGVEHKAVKKILDKTKKFHVCRYTKAEIKASKKKKIELLKDIARSPSSAKNLNFRVSVSVNELEELAPVMRFNLLKWYYKDRMKQASTCHSRPGDLQRRLNRTMKNSPTNNINMPNFSEKDLQKLLFTVGIKKNAETSQFTEAYKAYKKISQGLSMTRQEAQQAFGREYSYYYW